MKKYIINIIEIIIGIIFMIIFWNIPRIKYDVNRDGKVDTDDMLKVQEYYLNH